MKITVCAIIIVLVIIISTVVIMLLNPLRKSEEDIRDDLLRITPIGMSRDDVIEVIRSSDDWELRHVFDRGYIVGRWYVRGPHQGSYRPGHDVEKVGVKSMEVYIGSYYELLFAFEIRVSVFFGFDEDSNLVDLGVRKYGMFR